MDPVAAQTLTHARKRAPATRTPSRRACCSAGELKAAHRLLSTGDPASASQERSGGGDGDGDGDPAAMGSEPEHELATVRLEVPGAEEAATAARDEGIMSEPRAASEFKLEEGEGSTHLPPLAGAEAADALLPTGGQGALSELVLEAAPSDGAASVPPQKSPMPLPEQASAPVEDGASPAVAPSSASPPALPTAAIPAEVAPALMPAQAAAPAASPAAEGGAPIYAGAAHLVPELVVEAAAPAGSPAAADGCAAAEAPSAAPVALEPCSGASALDIAQLAMRCSAEVSAASTAASRWRSQMSIDGGDGCDEAGNGDELPPLVAALSASSPTGRSPRFGSRARAGVPTLGAHGSFSGDLHANALPPTHGRSRTESVTVGSDQAVVRQLPPPAAVDPLASPAAEQPVHAASAAFWAEASRQQDIADSVQRFNGRPRDGIAFLRAKGLLAEQPPGEDAGDADALDADARAIATYLHCAKGLSKRNIGDFLGDATEQSQRVLALYTRSFDFAEMPFVDALRAYLTPFRLPGESQKIDRIMNCFAAHYHATNPTVFSHQDTPYVLAFSLIMLNVDLHSPHITKKMTEAEFIRNNRGVDQGRDIAEHILVGAYHDIKRTEIKTTTAFEELSQQELVNWLAQGSVFIKFTHGRVGALKTPRHEMKLWISNDRLCYRNSEKRKLSRGEKQVELTAITEVIVGPKSQVFRRHGVRASAKGGEGGGGADEEKVYFSLVFNQRTLDLQASNPELGDFWSRYFRQVVERSRIEATQRTLALRAQPRERFLELAARKWAEEILPDWERQRGLESTRTLWWEGIPSSERGKVWLYVLGEDSASLAKLSAERGRRPLIAGSGAGSVGRLRAEHAEALASASAWLDEQLPPDLAELFSLYGCARSCARRRPCSRPAVPAALSLRPRLGSAAGCWSSLCATTARPRDGARARRRGGGLLLLLPLAQPLDIAVLRAPRPARLPLRSRAESPLRSDAVAMLATLQLELDASGAVPVRIRAPCAPLIAGMLLIHLEPPHAYAALASLVQRHVPGATDPDAMQWRNCGVCRLPPSAARCPCLRSWVASARACAHRACSPSVRGGARQAQRRPLPRARSMPCPCGPDDFSARRVCVCMRRLQAGARAGAARSARAARGRCYRAVRVFLAVAAGALRARALHRGRLAPVGLLPARWRGVRVACCDRVDAEARKPAPH